MDPSQQNQVIRDALARLPEVLRNTIMNADVQTKLRRIAENHKIHLDKWVVLENELMMALLGITNPYELEQNIVAHAGVSAEEARAIIEEAEVIIFDPIQDELRAALGESQSIVEHIDATTTQTKTPIDISKFTQTPTDPSTYTPNTEVKKVIDPYQEPVE